MMNKIIPVALLVCAPLLVACYQTNSGGSNNAAKPVQSTPMSSPVAEKTAETNVQTIQSGDYTQAMSYFNSKDFEKAAAEFEAVVKTDAKNQQAHFHLGKSYQALNKTDLAIGAYRKAIDAKPDYAEANYELGKIYFDKKDYQASLPFIEKASKIKFTSPEYLVTLGDNYRELKRCDYAMVPYGKVSGFDAKNTTALYGMGLCYIELKNRIAASQQVRNLEQLDKNLAKKLADQIPK